MCRRRYECAKQHRFSTLEFIAEPTAGTHGQPLQAKYTPEKAPCN
jgi:hypothetical protein